MGWLDDIMGNWWVVVLGILTVVLAVWLSGCCLFERPPVPITEVQTVTNTVIKQVKVNDWLVTGSILVMGISVFGFLNGWKQGINSCIGAGVVLGVSLVLKSYGGYLVFGGALLLALYIGWQIWVRVRALKEVVSNVEGIKDSAQLRPENGVSLTLIKDMLGGQTEATKKIVSSIKAKL
jgi:Zn-dependent protease